MADTLVTDAPRHLEAARSDDELFRVEERGLEPVPDSARHGRPRELFFIWAAALADFFSFFAGATNNRSMSAFGISSP